LGRCPVAVSIATDAGLGSLVGSQPIETSALSLAPAVTLHVGTYYWAITPLDAVYCVEAGTNAVQGDTAPSVLEQMLLYNVKHMAGEVPLAHIFNWRQSR
jgi:hypothetical protein